MPKKKKQKMNLLIYLFFWFKFQVQTVVTRFVHLALANDHFSMHNFQRIYVISKRCEEKRQQ